MLPFHKFANGFFVSLLIGSCV